MNTQKVQMVLETNKFRELLREVYDLACIALEPKYNLRSIESLREYDLWAPYILQNYKSGGEQTGFKLFMIDMMSMLLVMKDGIHDRKRYIVSPEEIKEMYKVNPPREIKNIPQPEVKIVDHKSFLPTQQGNVIDFSQYKNRTTR